MSMTLDEYQSHVLTTSNPWVDENPLYAQSNWALGLTGEAGELLELSVGLSVATSRYADDMKKAHFHEHGEDKAKAVKELGDILWYVARAAKTLGVPLSEVASLNVAKLQARYPNGWSREDSIARVDTVTVTKTPALGPSILAMRAIDQQDGPAPIIVDIEPARGESVSWAMGPGHQTDPSDPWCAVHDSTCPEWCESDPADGYEVKGG